MGTGLQPIPRHFVDSLLPNKRLGPGYKPRPAEVFTTTKTVGCAELAKRIDWRLRNDALRSSAHPTRVQRILHGLSTEA